MDTDAASKPAADKKPTDSVPAQEGKAEEAAPAAPEPSSHTLDNPARVVPAQVGFGRGGGYFATRWTTPRARCLHSCVFWGAGGCCHR